MDLIKQTEDIMAVFGVATSLIKENDVDIILNKGINKLIYDKSHNGLLKADLKKLYKEKVVYITKDSFYESYMSIRLPKKYNKGNSSSYLFVGPYLTSEAVDILNKVLNKNKSLLNEEQLGSYYKNLPYIKEPEILESIFLIQTQFIYNDKNIEINRIENAEEKRARYIRVINNKNNDESNKIIERRYELEYELLNAVKDGDLEKALFYQSKIGKSYDIDHPYNHLDLRGQKNKMITLNTLLRKAVQQSGINPAYIDEISSRFGNQIEESKNSDDLLAICNVIYRDYCKLVREHALKGYSEIIRNAINYIDFNIKEELNLKKVANEINVNATYLSSQFKKEVGKTITDYINKKRIDDSLIYLSVTDMPVQKIAENVGIYDENYFSRLFKKYQGMTPMQYRNYMRSY